MSAQAGHDYMLYNKSTSTHLHAYVSVLNSNSNILNYGSDFQCSLIYLYQKKNSLTSTNGAFTFANIITVTCLRKIK